MLRSSKRVHRFNVTGLQNGPWAFSADSCCSTFVSQAQIDKKEKCSTLVLARIHVPSSGLLMLEEDQASAGTHLAGLLISLRNTFT